MGNNTVLPPNNANASLPTTNPKILALLVGKTQL